MLWFAAIYDVWKAPGDLGVLQVAVVTCAPNADVEPIHHRMGVLIDQSAIGTWLGDDLAAASDLMVPCPAGRLSISETTDVNWQAP